MVRHVALFRWADGVTEGQRQVVRDALAALPALIPELREYRFGDDAGLAEGNHDFAVVADFDDAAGFRAYQEHPEHRRVLTEVVRPLLAARAAVQFEWTGTAPGHR